jgi:RHH-type proline utilization regulon transcriptional repressor/proline dehydrogenase/delta 1-pyrroline-5-carboxylate dehydrogenase
MTNDLYQIKTNSFEYSSDRELGLKKNEDTSWSIEFYELFENYLFDDKILCESLKSYISYVEDKRYDLPFRFSLNEKSLQFTCALFPKEKRVLIGSKQLGYELTLLRWYNDRQFDNEIASIKNFANKIASIPVENTPPCIDLITHRYSLVDFSNTEFERTLLKTEELSKHLVEKINTYNQSIFEKITDYGLDLTANFKLIRIHLLKFLAILPSLEHEKDGVEVKRLFLESLRRLNADSKKAVAKRLKGQDRGLPNRYLILIKVALNFLALIPAKFLANTIRFSVSKMAKRFIAGESIELAEKSLKELISSGRDATLDQLGELVVSKKEADIYERKVLEIIHGMSQHIITGKRNKAGINKAHISIKVSALTHDFKPHAFQSTYDSIAPRLKNILIEAKKHEVFINIDAEHYHYRDVVLDVYAKVLRETEELKTFADTGIVIQAYLRDGHKHLSDVLDLARDRGIRMPIRLVKGAYWDVETVEASAHNFEAPQFLNKEETDIHFRQLTFLILKNSKFLHLAIASHNIQDHCFAEALRETHFPESPTIEHQTLHMTYEALSHGLNLMNWPSRNYIPVGDLIVGMAYLVRRIMENSSQVGILTIMRSHKKKLNFESPESILKNKFLKKEIIYDESILKLRREFKNIYPVRTYLKEQLSLVHSALLLEEGKITNEESKSVKVYSPSASGKVIGSVDYDTVESVDKKIKILAKKFDEGSWSSTSSNRHAAIFKLADLILINRGKLASLIILEAGKTLEEALADVDEAIDFIQFYLREYFNISIDSDSYVPRGVFGVIAPWNFPLAIPVGMTISGLITGNTVLLKPAEQTPLIALEFHRLALESGIPEDCFMVALGEGDIGSYITIHENIDGVVFTGSVGVGCEIYEKIKSKTSRGSTRTAITEMGGKNAIIVTNNCELDETVSGIIYASFAHAGQKCSAASRIIIDSKVKDAFVDRFVDAVKDIKVGKSHDFDTMINPLASEEDMKRLLKLNQMASDEVKTFGGEVHLDLSSGDYPGNCVGPSIYELTAKRSMDKTSIAQAEIFGPLIHIIPFDNIDEAVEIFNSTDYALTGGIFCQSQDDIDYLTPKLECGNIYINRPNTGARVAIEPFGGFKFSGTGPKAGSVDYLYQFLKIKNAPNEEELSFYDNIKVKTQDDYDRTTTSKLSERKRLDLTIELVDRLMNRYESFFQGINHDRKDLLMELYNFFKDDSNLLESKEFTNREIPGQLNYDLRDFKLGRGYFIVHDSKVDFNILLDVLINISIGNSINLVCLNEDVYNSWKPIIDLSYVVGFSAFNIAIFRSSKAELVSSLENDQFEFIVSENNKFLVDLISSFAFKKKKDAKSLVKYVVSSEGIPAREWERYIKEYTIPRSFAINTMRHGAPLELNI